MAYDNMKQFPFKDGYSFLEFNGVNIGAACEMFILGKGTYGAPSRDVDQIHVPGRNGDILVDNGGWNNVTVKYPDCNILSNFGENVEKLRGYLFSNPGYHTLIDQYHPDEVRYAEFRGPFTADAHTGTGNDSGSFDLEFNCKPQRFLRESFYDRSYYLCPERVISAVNSNHYAYNVEEEVAIDGGNIEFTFTTKEDDITVSNAVFVSDKGTEVAYDGKTVFKNGVVSIPLIDKKGKTYKGFKGEIHANKMTDFRMESSKVENDKRRYYYYKDGSVFCFPFTNPTPYDAYPIIKGNYTPSGSDNTEFICGGNILSVNNSDLGYSTTTTVKVEFDGTNKISKTYDSPYSDVANYAGISTDFPVIKGGESEILKITNAASIGDFFNIRPMYYRI